MADTIITNTPDSQGDSGAAGWIFALLIIVAMIVGGIVLYQNGFLNPASDTNDTTNINVTVPDPIAPATTPEPTE